MHESNRNMKTGLSKICLLLVGLSLSQGTRGGDVYIEVDTGAGTVTVLEAGAVLQVFEDIAIGRFGTTHDKQQGDNMTPLGNYHIGWITDDSGYYRFAGIDYPAYTDASRGLAKGIITRQQWAQIRRNHKSGKVPPQTTPLGGYLGIHGIGGGDIEVHREFNWTNGCIALTNEQMDRLLELVEVGTPVEIR